MKLIPNIAILTTLSLSALLLSACAGNSEPDAVARSASTETTQPDNNFGKNVETEKTIAPKATAAASTKPADVKTTTKNTPQKTKKAKKKVSKKTDPSATGAPATN